MTLGGVAMVVIIRPATHGAEVDRTGNMLDAPRHPDAPSVGASGRELGELKVRNAQSAWLPRPVCVTMGTGVCTDG